jgi:Tfp pilus assembly protein PilV
MINREQGQSLFEVVVAIAISALIIVTIVSLATNSIQNSSFSKNKTLAATYVQEATEWLRGQRDTDMNAFVSHTVIPTWCLQSLSWSIPGACGSTNFIADTSFIRQATFAVSTVNGKDFIESNVTVSWQDAKGIHQVTSSTNLSDWRQR